MKIKQFDSWKDLINTSDAQLRDLPSEKLLAIKNSVEGGWDPLHPSVVARLNVFSRVNRELTRRGLKKPAPRLQLRNLPVRKVLNLTGVADSGDDAEELTS